MCLLHDLVAIRQDDPDNKTKSGLFLAEQIKTYQPIGTVEAVGSSISMLKKGDRVVYKPHGGTLIEIDGQELDIVSIDAVIGTICE